MADELLKEPPLAGDEVATMLGSLERQRRTFAWKCTGVDAEGMAAAVGASTITLGGLLKHLALVEDLYFTLRLGGGPMPEPWAGVDWDSEPGWEWRSAAADSPAQLIDLWKASVERSRAVLSAALADDDLGQLLRHVDGVQDPPSLRRVLVDVVEEYARHVGHADLIRESVDGLVGEDPPA